MNTPPCRWMKSSRSSATNSCVEIANTLDQLRDSKNPDGPVLLGPVNRLLDAVKAGRFG
jgi:hypothetical protein